MTTKEILKINKQLKEKTPLEICQWAVAHGKNPIVTTNFRPYEAAILYTCVKASPNIPVVWFFYVY